MITEHSNGEKPAPNSPGLAERVGGGVLEFVLPGHEHKPIVAKTVGAGLIAIVTVGVFEAAWLWTTNTVGE